MKKILILILCLSNVSIIKAEENLRFFVNKAINNNLQLSAERKNLESTKQSQNISRSEFLPSITITSEQSKIDSSNRTNQSGANLSNTNLDSESRSISLEQTLFSGFKGLNTLKKTELETKKANLQLIQVEQQTILDTVFAYFDFRMRSAHSKSL